MNEVSGLSSTAFNMLRKKLMSMIRLDMVIFVHSALEKFVNLAHIEGISCACPSSSCTKTFCQF